MCGPGALLNLQLAPFNVQVITLVCVSFQLNEQLSRFMLCVNQRHGSQDTDDGKYKNEQERPA
jgi:hypothetical protein